MVLQLGTNKVPKTLNIFDFSLITCSKEKSGFQVLKHCKYYIFQKQIYKNAIPLEVKTTLKQNTFSVRPVFSLIVNVNYFKEVTKRVTKRLCLGKQQPA